MRKIQIVILLSVSIWTSNINAQMPGGSMTPPEFNAEKVAGLINYELEEVLKKLKIKDEEQEKGISEALKTYNTRIDELSYQHASTFIELEDAFEQNLAIAMQNRDKSQMNGVKSKIEAIIPPIRSEVMAEEQILNEAMELILTEKQNEKWLKYQKREKGQPGPWQN